MFRLSWLLSTMAFKPVLPSSDKNLFVRENKRRVDYDFHMVTVNHSHLSITRLRRLPTYNVVHYIQYRTCSTGSTVHIYWLALREESCVTKYWADVVKSVSSPHIAPATPARLDEGRGKVHLAKYGGSWGHVLVCRHLGTVLSSHFFNLLIQLTCCPAHVFTCCPECTYLPRPKARSPAAFLAVDDGY